MGGHDDRPRWRRTDASTTARRITVVSAANSLCAGSSFREVSLDSICARAGISKSSFYRLFPDKQDIAYWALSVPALLGVGETGRTLTCLEGVRYTLGGLATFKNLCVHALENPGDLVPGDRLHPMMMGKLRRTIRDHHGVEADDRLEFEIRWNSAAAVSVIREWLVAGCDVDVGEMASRIVGCCPSRLRAILDAPVDPRPCGDFDLKGLVFTAVPIWNER